ncbi:MAG TPA: metallophosphoesterase family protein [Gemmataceae bacterium]|nr:metallophosphoesterase family protein [Gemmataceae bacterium]
MRTLAIGDLHGCSRALDTLLAMVGPRPKDQVVTLGDYVDRGPDSCGVIERLLRLRRASRLIALRGNHDQMMVGARQGAFSTAEWLARGGRQTLDSYSVPGVGGRRVEVPEEHWDFLENALVNWHETDTHFFVHANVYPDLPLQDQPTYMLLWEFLHDPAPHCSGKVMVCGHTSQKSGRPLNLGHAICIDTRAYAGGWLTCLDVTSGKVWQANQRGEQRTAWVDDFAA